jgi:beta-glucosidase
MPVDLPGFRGGDRTNIELPDVQRTLLKALKAAGKKIIFVNCSGSAIALTPETESCDAIIQAWYGGEQGGQAVADVIFGDYNPTGKLPITFYKNSAQIPEDFEDYSMKGKTYRYMDDALFPFGYGLSYTKFNLGNATLSKTNIKANENITLTIPVTNAGKRSGAEVVQVYVRKINDSDDAPLKTLRAYKRVEIAAGKTANVSLVLAPDAFEFFDNSKLTMAIAAGEYEILYGNTSESKDLKTARIVIND